MIDIIITELQKLKRYSILWIGIVVVSISPAMSVFTQSMYVKKDPTYGFSSLVNDTIWNNMGLFLPITISLIGGYMINREYTENTLKNILTIPMSFRKMLIGKILTLAIVTILFSFYSFIITLICSIIFFPKDITFIAIIKSLAQIIGMAICIYIAELPIIVFCSRKPNMFMGGVIISFVYGYFSIFLSGQNLQDIYPLSAGLGIIGFSGNTGSNITTYNPIIGLIVLCFMIIIAIVILMCTKNNEYENTKNV